jgi:transcriptional regulator with XRE-family HTH domain
MEVRMLALRVERQRRGWSITEVTRRTGIAESHLSNLERQLIPAYPGWKRRIAKAFKMPASELFREVENDTGK